MKCEDCGYEFEGPVCINCGLVYEDHPIDSGSWYDEDTKQLWRVEESIQGKTLDINGRGNEKRREERPLYVRKWYSPDIKYATTHGKTKNPDLKRAFKIEQHGFGKVNYGKSYIYAYNEIKRICDDIGLSKNIKNNAIYWLRQLTERGYIKRSYKKFACYPALIILAARYLNRLPISFAEISEFTDEKPKKIRQAYREIKKELKIATNPFYLEEIVSYHYNKLGCSEMEKRLCINFAKKVVTTGGRIPYGYSAAIIRIITNRTRRELSKKLKVSEPTITSRMRELGVYEM